MLVKIANVVLGLLWGLSILVSIGVVAIAIGNIPNIL